MQSLQVQRVEQRADQNDAEQRKGDQQKADFEIVANDHLILPREERPASTTCCADRPRIHYMSYYDVSGGEYLEAVHSSVAVYLAYAAKRHILNCAGSFSLEEERHVGLQPHSSLL